MWHEVDLGGVLISPIVVAGCGAVAIVLLLRIIAQHFRLLRWAWHPAALEVSVVLIVLTALMFWK